MDTEEEYDALVALARQFRAEIEALEGDAKVRNNYNEFRKRFKVAGVTIDASVASRLWKQSAEEEEFEAKDSDEDFEAEIVDEVPPPGGGLDDQSPIDGREDQGLSLADLQRGFFVPIQDDETLDEFEERLA